MQMIKALCCDVLSKPEDFLERIKQLKGKSSKSKVKKFTCQEERGLIQNLVVQSLVRIEVEGK